MKGLAQKERGQIYDMQGVKYSDSVSVFSVDDSILEDFSTGTNVLDLYLGTIAVDERFLPRGLGIGKLATFATVDFYNHDTQHSNIAEGMLIHRVHKFY